MNYSAEKYLKKCKGKKLSFKKLREAEKRAKKLKSSTTDFLTLLQLAKDCMSGRYMIETKDLMLIVAGIIYVISPADSVPDYLPMVGYLDDIGVVSYIAKRTSKTLCDYRKYRKEIEMKEK